jgi:membrane protease YdiL (CAAX protease family)
MEMGKNNKTYLIFEFTSIFILLPLLVTYFELHRLFLILLWLLAAMTFFYLIKDKDFNRKELLNAGKINKCEIEKILKLFIPSALFLTIFTYYFEPDRFIAFMLENTGFWLLVMILYPILSVYPQEMIYRTFIFNRYDSIFTSNISMILASAFAFGLVHIIFHNLLAVFLSMIGGIIFSVTYQRTRSLLLVSLEHALYGCFIFTVGLGWYFYRGSIGID